MEFDCIILSGGKSSRLGTDKATIHFKGATILNNLTQEVQQLANNIIIVSNNAEHHQEKTVNIVEQNTLGPLNGLLNGLSHIKADWVLVLSTDMPLLNVKKLVHDLKIEVQVGLDAVIPIFEGRSQYLAAFYNKKIFSTIEKLISSEKYTMKSLIETLSQVSLIQASENNFANFNNLEDIQNENLNLVKIIPFGQLQEIMNAPSIPLITTAKTLGEFKIELETNYPKIKRYTYQIAINQHIENGNALINSNDEIALLPPFAGG